MKDNDGDGDGKSPRASRAATATITTRRSSPAAVEIVGDGKDNDCDGLADEDALNVRELDRHDGSRSRRSPDGRREGDSLRRTRTRRRPQGLSRRSAGMASTTTATASPIAAPDSAGNVDVCVQPGTTRSTLADITLDPLSFNGNGSAGDRVQRRRHHVVDANNVLKLNAGPGPVQRQRSR